MDGERREGSEELPSKVKQMAKATKFPTICKNGGRGAGKVGVQVEFESQERLTWLEEKKLQKKPLKELKAVDSGVPFSLANMRAEVAR